LVHIIFLLKSVGHFILQDIGILTDTVTVQSTSLPVASRSNDFCSRNVKGRMENGGDRLFLNVIPCNLGNCLSVLPVVTFSVLEVSYSQV